MNDVADCLDFAFVQFIRFSAGIYLSFFTNFSGTGLTNPVNISQSDPNVLFAWKVHTRNACHSILLTLSLFVPRVFTNYTHNTPTLHNFAFVANFFN